MEYLFINAVKIEYNYYVKKEQAKQEQAAIREQMRQEAAERKALEAEKKKIEAEPRDFDGKMCVPGSFGAFLTKFNKMAKMLIFSVFDRFDPAGHALLL